MATEQFKLTVSQLTTLMTIDFSTCIGFTPTGTTLLRLSAYRNGNNDVVYDGNTYQYVGFEAQGFRSELNGQVPAPTVVFDRASLFGLTDYNTLWDQYTAQTGEDYFDWRGAQVKVFRTIGLNTAQQLNTQEYTVSQVNRVTASTLEVQLTVSLGIDKLTNQSIQSLSLNRCSRRYRTWNGSTFDYTDTAANGCPYGNPTSTSNWSAVPFFGTKYYTNADQPLADANKNLDKCSYSVKGCQLRFDPDETGLALPFKGLYAPTKIG